MVPASTILLAVATAIPFGLAIRDTLAGTYDERSSDEASDDELDERDLQAAAARYAQDRAEEALERQLRLQRIRELVGRDLATPGPVFSPIHLGDPVGTSSVESSADAQLMLLDDGAHSHSLYLKLHHRDEGDCEQLETTVRTAWGEPKVLDNRWIWVGASQRAVWNPEDCSLTFERISSLEAFVGASQLPLAAIGKPTKALLDQLGARTMDTAADDQITWTLPGIGTGHGVTRMTADVEDGKVVAVTAALYVDPITQTELSAQITRVVGRSPAIPADRPDTEIWKPTRLTPRIQLVEGAPQLFLTVGSRPE